MRLKTATSLLVGLVVGLASAAHAQDDNKKPAAPKTIESSNPWSVDTMTKSDGYFGSSSTTIKRDMGEGWSLGGKMTTPYEDRKIGGSGAPGFKQYENRSNTTVFGPVLEKKF